MFTKKGPTYKLVGAINLIIGILLIVNDDFAGLIFIGVGSSFLVLSRMKGEGEMTDISEKVLKKPS